MSAKSPCVKKQWPKRLNLNTASALKSQRTCEAVTNACLHLPHPGLSTSPNLNRYPFKGQCHVSSLVIILSYFLLKFSNPPSFFSRILRGNMFKKLAWYVLWITQAVWDLCEHIKRHYMMTIVSNGQQWMWKQSWSNFRHHVIGYVEGLRKTTLNFNGNRWYRCWGLKPDVSNTLQEP